MVVAPTISSVADSMRRASSKSAYFSVDEPALSTSTLADRGVALFMYSPKDSFVFDGFHPSMVRCIHVNGNAEIPKVLFDQWLHVCPCEPTNAGC